MTWKLSALILPILFFLLPLSCTNFDLDPLGKRVDENLDGQLTAPSDIDPAGTDSFSFVVMGDTHIGSPGGEVMQRIVREATSTGDAFAVITGDITAGALEGEFNQFKTVFSDNNLAFRAVIGNHDIFFGGWDRFKTQIGKSIYSFNADNVHFVMIDSANGVLGERQLEWIENDLRLNTRPNTVMVTHFPPWNGYFSSIYKMSSEEEAANLKNLAHKYGVKFVFGGHFHGFAEQDIGGTKYVVTGGANDIIDLGQRMNYVRIHVSGNTMTMDVIYL